MLRRAALLLATWFGCGLSPFAPGTAGSAAALAIAWAAGFPQWQLAMLAAFCALVGLWAAERAAQVYGEKDPGRVVIDEVAGMWLTLAGATHLNTVSLIGGFLLFRVFDIWKPFPARRLESLPGGLGIVADDLMAGLYAALVLFLAGCLNLY
jgi:phosphatidylglycerophosphatase A